MTIAKFAAAIAVSAMCMIAPAALAGDTSPVGTWQTTSGESRYSVSYCGDGTALCAKLTWLRADARTPENLQYLNQFVVHGAQATAQNQWRGTVNYAGESIRGSVTMVSGDRLKVKGCKFIACQSLDFVRI